MVQSIVNILLMMVKFAVIIALFALLGGLIWSFANLLGTPIAAALEVGGHDSFVALPFLTDNQTYPIGAWLLSAAEWNISIMLCLAAYVKIREVIKAATG